MSDELQRYLQEKKELVEASLRRFLPASCPPLLKEAMEYSLFAGGKRLRPILLLATLEAFGKDVRIGLPTACAIEMIHTYSLIHDDLPAMDDDDVRRGKPTNHKVYGEAVAILAGDALLTHAFHVIVTHTPSEVTKDRVLRVVEDLSHYAGPSGMVGGQTADLLGEQRSLTLEEIRYIHEHKTSDLLQCSVRAGAWLADAAEAQMEKLTTFARLIGLAFQIQDDILDIVGDEKRLGKQTGSDEAKQKSTYPSLLGLEKAREEVSHYVQLAKAELEQTPLEQKRWLYALADFIMERNK